MNELLQTVINITDGISSDNLLLFKMDENIGTIRNVIIDGKKQKFIYNQNHRSLLIIDLIKTEGTLFVDYYEPTI